MSELVVEYLCILDSGCQGREHSLNCRDMNAQRAAALRQKERKRRLLQMSEDIDMGPEVDCMALDSDDALGCAYYATRDGEQR